MCALERAVFMQLQQGMKDKRLTGREVAAFIRVYGFMWTVISERVFLEGWREPRIRPIITLCGC